MTLGVFADQEFRRIRDLPRREPHWPKEKLDEAVEALTEHFRVPGGTLKLKPIQARALCEAHDADGLVGDLPAGSGKFLLSALLFTLWGAKRGLLIVPAALREQTKSEWKRWSQHFRLLPLYELGAGAAAGPHVRLISYETLSTVGCATFLDEYQPDVVVADEAHKFARLKSSRSRKIFRYLKAARKAATLTHGPAVRFVPLSATFRRRSMRECAHLYEAALGPRSPFPITYPALEQWSFAIDEGVRDDARIAPGALTALCTPEQLSSGLDGVRRAVRDRVLSAPGVVSSAEPGVDVALILQARHIEVPSSVVEALTRIRQEQVLPTGESFDAGVAAWSHSREAGAGFVYHYDPPPPEAWAAAKRGWAGFVKIAIDEGLPDGGHLDSPLAVWNAVAAGKFGPPEAIAEWTRWRDIRSTFTPNPIPHWVSDYLVKDAEDWALKNRGCVWLGFSSAFTKATGAGLVDADEDDAIGAMFKRIPYFGGGRAGDAIRTHKGPCAASIRAHGTGRNLQQFSRALIMTLPSSGATLEQLLARHHREGQTADEVHVEFYCHTYEMYDAFVTARNDARYAEAMNGAPQRVLYSTVLGPEGQPFDDGYYAALAKSGDPLWTKPGNKPK